MKYVVIGLILTLLVIPPDVAFSYGIKTHEQMSEAALDASILTTDPSVLSDLGLEPLDKEQKFFHSTLETSSSLKEFLRFGVEQEDNLRGSRFLHHFYDPINDTLLTDISANGILALVGPFGQPFLPLQIQPRAFFSLVCVSPINKARPMKLRWQSWCRTLPHWMSCLRRAGMT